MFSRCGGIGFNVVIVEMLGQVAFVTNYVNPRKTRGIHEGTSYVCSSFFKIAYEP